MAKNLSYLFEKRKPGRPPGASNHQWKSKNGKNDDDPIVNLKDLLTQEADDLIFDMGQI